MSLTSAIVVAIITAIIGPLIVYYVTNRSRDNSDKVMYGVRVGIRVSGGRYVQSKLFEHNAKLFALERHVKEWEFFEIVKASSPFSINPNRPIRYGDKIGLCAENNNNFVGVKMDSDKKELTVDVKHLKSWETFVLLPAGNGWKRIFKLPIRYGDFFALRADNGKQVRFDRYGDRCLAAVAPHIKDWETFVFVKPSNPK